MSKVALITGVTGQDGSYPAEFLLEKGMRCMVSSVARHRLIPSAWTIFIRTRTAATRNFICIMAT